MAFKLGKGSAFVKSRLRRLPQDDDIEESFPAIADWVRHDGWIEIGDQDGVGFVARALDCGGLVYESDDCRSFGEALSSLEKGVAHWLEQQSVE